MKKGIIVILIIIFLVLALLLFKKWTDYSIMDKGNMTWFNKELRDLLDKEILTGKLTKIIYSNSGDMNGNVYEIIIDTEKLSLVESKKNEISDPLEVKEYSVTEEDINNLKDMIKEYNLPAWSTLEIDNELIVLDGSTPNLVLYFDNTDIGGSYFTTYSINHYMKLPEGAMNLLNTFEKNIFDLRKEESLIKEYTKENE